MAWEEYRAQMTQESTIYYNYHSLQNQLSAGNSTLQTSSFASTSDAAGSSVESEVARGKAAELLTVLANANKNVTNLVALLKEKAVLTDILRRGIPPPPNYGSRAMEIGKRITEQYKLVGEGVQRVNSTLQRYHDDEVHLDPGINQLANKLRLELIQNLDGLRSGSNQPVVNTSSVAATIRPATHVTQHHAANAAHIQQQAMAQRRAILMQHAQQVQQKAGQQLKH